MLRFLYTGLFYLAIPVILLRLLWRSRHNPAYRQRWAERFACFSLPPQARHGLWVHAVSLGEVVAATPLIKAIQKQYPELPIVITTMTITGSQRVQATFEDDTQVFHVYVPYDLPRVTARFLANVKPKAGMIIETELWPNLLAVCQRAQLPLMLANARLSARSAKGYQRIALSTETMLSAFSVISAHAKTDGQRFIDLGADKSRVHITGSIKFENHIPASIYEQAEVLREQWGRNRPIWVIASTHDNEEAQLLGVYQRLLANFPNLLLIIVPRHPERFAEVTALCRNKGYRVITRRSNNACDDKVQIIVGDTMGELKLFYAASDIAFVGGSLVKIGGHNVLEAVGLGKPCLTGPYMFNFSEITQTLLDEQALIQVESLEQLEQAITALLQDSSARAKMSECCLQVLEKHKGALQKNLDLLAGLLG